jgi:hypothetical protein
MTDHTLALSVPMCSRCAYAVVGKASAISLVRARTGGLRDTLRPPGECMATTGEGLDATSRRLLNEIDELKRLELERRRSAPGQRRIPRPRSED